MTQQYNDEDNANIVIIEAQTKNPFDKDALINLLKEHKVKTASAESADVTLQDVLPTLNKTKTTLPESFFEDFASKIGVPYLSFRKVEEIYGVEQKSKLITILPYSIISKYKAVPLQVNDDAIELAVDNPLR